MGPLWLLVKSRKASSSSARCASELCSRPWNLSAQMAKKGSYVAYPSDSGSRMERNSRSSAWDEGGMPRALRTSHQYIPACLGRRGQRVHQGGLDVVNGQHAVLLAIHRLGEQAEGFLDLALLLRGDVVLLGELRLARLRGARRRSGACFALRRLVAPLVSGIRCGSGSLPYHVRDLGLRGPVGVGEVVAVGGVDVTGVHDGTGT